MVAMADPYTVVERRVSRRLRDDESHRRVASALADIAVAAIYPSRYVGSERSAIGGLLEDPIASATRVAVETLIDELEDLVDTLPPSTLERLVAEQRDADLGLE